MLRVIGAVGSAPARFARGREGWVDWERQPFDTLSMHLAFHDSERFAEDQDRTANRSADWPTLRFPAPANAPSASSTTSNRADHEGNADSIPFPPQHQPPLAPSPAAAEHSAPPIGPEHLQALHQANSRAQKIKRAAAVAGFNGWFTAIMAGFSGLAAIFSWSSLIIALLLAYIAAQEFRGRQALRHLEPKAAPRLGWNQVLFASLIVLYALWGGYQTLTAPVLSAQYEQYGAEVAGMMQPFDSVYTGASLAFYAAVALFGVIFQGGTACYYFTRQPHLADYVRSTPRWIIDLQRQHPSF